MTAPATHHTPPVVHIDVVSDVICPWCFIGKRRLEKAIAALASTQQCVVRWLPFQLNPEMPTSGMPRATYRSAKFGSVEKAQALDARMSAEAAREGLAFDFSRVTITPNTQLAHQMIAYAQSKQVGDAVVEDIFSAYFLHGRDVGSRDELLQIAQRSGLEAESVTAMWDAGAVARDVAETEQQMRALDISGVPFFILERKLGVSGAQAPEALIAAIRQASN